MRSSFKINSNNKNNDGQWMQKKRKREETSRLSLPGNSSQKSPKRTKLTPDGKYSSLATRQNDQYNDDDIQSSPQDLQITSSPITLSPIKAPTSPTPSQLVFDPTSNFDEVDRIESSPTETSHVPEVKLERRDSISLLRQSNEEFLAAASTRIKTTTPDKKSRLSPSPLKLPSSQSSPKHTRVHSPPALPTRVHRSQPVTRKLEKEFEEEIEDDIVESEEQIKYNQSKLMVSNIEEIDAAFKGDDIIEDEIDSSPVAAVSKFSPLVKHQNELLKQMRENAKVPVMPALNDSIEESQDSQKLDEMLTMESVHRTPTKFQATQQHDIEDIEEHDDNEMFERSSPPAGQSVVDDFIADSPDHVPESPPMQRRSPDIFENQNLRLLVDDVDDNDNEDDIFTAALKEEKEEARASGPVKFNIVNNSRIAESQPQLQQQQQQETWNTADKIRGSFISPLKRTQQPVVLKEGLRIRPVQSSGVSVDQTFLNKISVNSGQFTQFVPNEENTGRKGMAHLVKGGLAERMAKLCELDKHKRKQLLHQMKNSEALADTPLNVKILKLRNVFNHLTVAHCRLENGEHTIVAFKHEKETVDVELPQIVEGISLTLIPPYYSPKAEQDGTSVLMASMYVQHERGTDEQDDMLSEEHEDSLALITEKLLSVYSPSPEFQHEPMQLVPITKAKEHEPVKENSLRVFVQRVVIQHFATASSATAAEETPRKKSRARPVLSDLCDGFFLNKLKQLQISQYNTDKLVNTTGLGARMIVQSSLNTVTVIDVKHSTQCEALLQCEGKWIIVKGLAQDKKLGVGGVPFGRVINHLQSTDQFSFALDTNANATNAVTYSSATLTALDKLNSLPITHLSVLGKVVFVDKNKSFNAVSGDKGHIAYVSDGNKTVVPIRVPNEHHQLREGQAYLFIAVNYHDNMCHANDYSAVETVRWVKKSAVTYSNTNALPGRRVLDQECVVREIGIDDTLCAALGINIKALETDSSHVPVPRDLSRGSVAVLSVKPTQVESQLQCTYCHATCLAPIAANTELSAALSLSAQQTHFKCLQCHTMQSADRARKSFKVHGECRLENKTVTQHVNVAAALVEQWTPKQKRATDPQAVIVKAVEKCLCHVVSEHQGLRADVIKSIV